MKDKCILYLSLFCLISLILTPIFFSNSFLRLFWLYPEKYDLELMENTIFCTSFLFFPILFIYQLISKQKDLALKISKISVVLFSIEVFLLLSYLYLLSHAVENKY